MIASGRQAIVLVPEISLTPQTVMHFKSRFDRLAVLHSRLTDLERKNQWLRIKAGEADVIIGARSAIFAPVPDLGLIVVDEEHENRRINAVRLRCSARPRPRWRATRTVFRGNTSASSFVSASGAGPCRPSRSST